jgi:uncharacterized protein YndB with AHSA1/START domain
MNPRPAAIAVQTFTVPAERVYDAILDPAMIARFMFGPLLREEEILHIRNDPRTGGEFSFKVRRDIPGQGPTDIDHIGRYLELVRPHRIVFSWGILGQSDPDESTVAIDITPTPDGCSLTLTHSMSPEWADFVSRARDSWAKMLDVLVRLLD